MLDSLLTRPGGSTAGSTGSRSINFTQFLTMFGHHLLDLADSEQEILEAFACFDEHDEGVVDVGGGDLMRRNSGTSVADGGQSTKIGQEGLRGWLRDYGDKMSDAEVSPTSPALHLPSTKCSSTR
jgi:Ca2+-binding EF-hand superfamily protein